MCNNSPFTYIKNMDKMTDSKEVIKQLRDNEYFEDEMMFKFSFYSEGEIYYESIGLYFDKKIQISFLAPSIYACHESHNLSYFEEELKYGMINFNYKIYAIKTELIEETHNYSTSK